MAHELEIVNGKANMVFAADKGLPWHDLGTPIEGDTCYSVAACIQAANLGKTVEKFELFDADMNNVTEQAEFYGIRRKGTAKIYGICKNSWQPVQDDEAFAFFQPFLDSKLCRMDTMGSLKDGQIVWGMANLVDTVGEVVKGDEVKLNVLLSNSHDGKTAIKVGTTPTRVVCMNTLAASYADKASRLIRVRHSAQSIPTLDKIRDIVGQLKEGFGKDLEKFALLARKPVTVATLELYFRTVLGIDPTTPRTDLHGKTINGLESLFSLFETGKGSDITGVHGTLWGAYNAVTESLSWQQGRNTDNRYRSLWFGQGATNNAFALETALAMAV